MRLLPWFALLSLVACRAEGETKFVEDRDNDGVPADEDCDDSDASVGAPVTYYTDSDGDGHGDPATADAACTEPADSSTLGDDCNDADATIYPGSDDICDGIDNDCDGTVDNGAESSIWYTDADGDGYGDDTSFVYDCSQPEGTSAVGGDCDDSDPAYNPGADESDCEDPNDYNCDGSTGYADADGDGWAACTECDDSNPSTHPGAEETCNGVDDDCNGTIDEEATDAVTWYADADADGYGDPTVTITACDPGEGWVLDAADCDDTDAAVNPAATEVCNGLDDDCDGLVDDADDSLDVSTASTWYTDADGDGYGDSASVVLACEQPAGTSAYDGDCNDADGAYNPGATESDCTDPNDYNCDGSVGYADNDGDGWAACEECDDSDAAIFPGADEYCNGVDDDCDGTIDEADALDSTTWYADIDGDGYGDPAVSTESCDPGAGWVTDATDCDDSRSDINPAATEICNGIDDDCDGDIDDADASLDSTSASTWYTDADSDGYGDSATAVLACEQPAGTSAFDGDCDDSDPAYNPGADESDCTDPNDYNCDGSTGYSDDDGDGWAACEDCDDSDAAVNPDATESCNGIDDDCDGTVDEDDASDAGTWYADTDGDGFGDPSDSVVACTAPAGYVADATDCDDSDASVNPAETEICNGIDDDCDGTVDTGAADDTAWYADADGDGYGDSTDSVRSCSQPSGYVLDDSDCDDADGAVNPAADEVCDGFDNDCDGSTDENTAVDAPTWYADSDTDGYGDPSVSVVDCTQPRDYVADDNDCDDTDGAVNPAATEVCDGIDNDCDGSIDENDAADAETWYADADGDGYGDAGGASEACSQPSGTVSNADDCDDTDSNVSPAGTESCNGIDDDCDGSIDEGVKTTYYADSDGDGYGDAGGTADACTVPSGYVANDDDCNDAAASINPGATETCNGYDDDCDGSIDEAGATGATTWYYDGDGDGYGATSPTATACSAPSGYVSNSSDCDDGDADINPGEIDVCDTVDNDCDGSKDNGGDCPCDVEEYGSHVYMFCESSKSTSSARTSCLTYAYDLVALNDSAENTWVVDEAYSRYTGKWWTGGSDEATEGTWVWLNGDSWSYTNWHSGEPNNSGSNEDCMQLGRFSDYTWNDEPCSSSFYYICEE
jgi:hypothetical protein